tara:strand:+ start:449 stop:685 length:237 start_codon:yes stop_codon:yes gene_type:complete
MRTGYEEAVAAGGRPASADQDAEMLRGWHGRDQGIFVGENGQAWCLCEAPDAETVVQSHEAVLFVKSLENVVEVTKLV